MCAVKQNGMALRFAVPELRADLSLVSEARESDEMWCVLH